jgi:hypothetical protein
MQRPFLDHPEIGAAFCRNIFIGEDGNWDHISYLEQRVSGVLPDWLERIAVGQRLQTPSMVVRRAVYEHLGGFDRRIARYGEDWEMWVRIAASYAVWYEVEPLALYRMRHGSLTSGSFRSGEDLRDLRMASVIIRSYLPEHRADELHARAREECALGGLRRLRRSLDSSAAADFPHQMWEVLRCRCSAKVTRKALPVVARWIRVQLRRGIGRAIRPRLASAVRVRP